MTHSGRRSTVTDRTSCLVRNKEKRDITNTDRPALYGNISQRLRAIIGSLSSVLVYIIDDSCRSGTEMKYPALSAEVRLLLREMASRYCRNYFSDRREACGLPKHGILYDQPSAVV